MPKWTPEQLDAIEKTGTNIIVSAGAGSGKTAVLTERVIHKLKNKIKINELLILTFTNAAAGEMKDRIRNKISEYPELKDNLDYLDSSYITTFDSFTLSLVKKYHYLLNVSPSLSIVDSGIINLKKEEILDEVFNKMYESNNESFLKLINDFCVKNDKTIKSSILKIISSLELKSNKISYLDSYIDNNFNKTKIEEYINEYLTLIKEEASLIETYLYLLSECDNQDYYEQMCIALDSLIKAKTYEEIKTSLNISLPRVPKGSEDIKEIKEQISLSVKKIKELMHFENIDDIYESFEITKTYVEAIILIIKMYDERINAYKKDNDLYEFTDIEMMAIDLLKKHQDICEEIKCYYKEIMIDEYQDTNDLQEEFISLIANNNVYMVGDIKQSIYGFRNANPEIFKEKYDKYSTSKDGIKIDLLKNFRSRSEVLSGINEIFNLIMDSSIGGADYKATHQMIFGNMSYEDNKKENQNYDLEILNYNDDDKTYSKEEKEAFIIGNDILNKIKKKYEVLDKKTGTLRYATYEDFCIIMDRGTSFNIYKKIFEYLHIPLVLYEDKKLTGETDILLINNIITLILKIKENIIDQEFRYAYVSVARSYLFNYHDNDILKIIKDKSYKESDIYQICANISIEIDALNICEIINKIIDLFNVYEKMVTTKDIEDKIVKLDNLLDIASNLSQMGYTLENFNEYLNKMLGSNYEISYKSNNGGLNSVKIMNIHKSKGLEFPVCYFSGYHKAFNTSDVKERFVYDDTYGIITPYFKDGIGTTILKDLLKNKYAVDNVSERIRLLYVALTRAKEKMIIVTSLGELELTYSGVVDIKMRKKYNSFLSIINSIKGHLSKYITNIDLNNINLTKDYLKVAQNELKISKKVAPINYQNIEVSNDFIEEKHASKTINKLITDDVKDTLAYGTLMHEVFENVDFLNIPKDHPYYDKISSFVKLLNITDTTKIYKEHEFIYDKDDVTYHGIIDLVLVEDTQVKIVDYKLKNIDDEKYIDQLKVYYDYLKLHFDKEIKMYLYSIIDNNLKEIK